MAGRSKRPRNVNCPVDLHSLQVPNKREALDWKRVEFLDAEYAMKRNELRLNLTTSTVLLLAVLWWAIRRFGL